MIFQTQVAPPATPQTSYRAVARPLVQRKCACGGTPGPTGECEECAKKKKHLQRKASHLGEQRASRSRSNGVVLQRKLAIGADNDPLEHDADRVADQVLAGPTHQALHRAPPRIQRFTGQASEAMDSAPSGVDQVLSTPGQALEPALRQDMERRFGHDFSRVRIHTSTAAAQSARDVNAHAYTAGNAIVFDAGRYAPQTHEGRRLIAHELTHTVQQTGGQNSGSYSSAGIIQREVNPKRIANKDTVLQKIQDIVDRTGKGKDPAEANLARLAKLGHGFNPGATKEEKDNAFVYTCNCGWIDMGHFFISAAAAYAIGYQRRRLELRVGGKPRSIEQLLAGASKKSRPVLEVLLKTVPDVEGREILANVDRLLASGEPRDIALVFGYWMEFVQQLAKLVSDPGRNLPEPLKEQVKGMLAEYQELLKSVAPEGLQGTIEGSARSAFTMEDLPSDCYGAALGQDVWKQTDGAKRDLPPIVGLMKNFFSECGAVYPEPGSRVRCEMMAETTPGSCHMEGDKDVWPADLGEPARYGSTKPRLLSSAKPLCGNASVVPCRSATGGAGTPLPVAIGDVSGRGATVTLTEDIPLHQPRERGRFGGEVSIPGRPEQIDPKAPLVLRGPSMVRVTPRGNVVAYSTLGGVPGIGDIQTAGHLDPSIGRYGAKGGLGVRGSFDVRGRGALQFDVQGHIDIDLGALLEGVAGPELADLKAVFTSDTFTELVKQVLKGDITRKQFMREVRTLLKDKFPQGFKGVIGTVISRLENLEALALSTSLHAQGVVSVGGIPISGFVAHKSFGLSPLLGVEGGLVLSELAKGRTILGAKGYLYGQDILQAQATVGIDPFGKKAIAELQAVNKTLTGNKLSLGLNYQINPAGDQQFLVVIGGEFSAFGSK